MKTPDPRSSAGGGPAPPLPPTAARGAPRHLGERPEPIAMTQAFWRLYKSKVLQTLGGEQADEEAEPPELMETAEPPALAEEGTGPVSQLARKVQGAGARGWRTLSSLFGREDEHQLLGPEPCNDHPLAASPEVPPAKAPGFWDLFATKWQQPPASDEPEPAESPGEPGDPAGTSGSGAGPGSELREQEEGAFRWGFLAGKLAEIRNKNAPKGT
ncbi:uncharacterized protein C1orf232 homolog [Dromaius novaehollandiae]|uniref:uncharacterized protein C1orf232 homolog n=1 Tax=Dromaius novaehollandiae TaxID=8790 RepID=UPI00311D4ECF